MQLINRDSFFLAASTGKWCSVILPALDCNVVTQSYAVGLISNHLDGCLRWQRRLSECCHGKDIPDWNGQFKTRWRAKITSPLLLISIVKHKHMQYVHVLQQCIDISKWKIVSEWQNFLILNKTCIDIAGKSEWKGKHGWPQLPLFRLHIDMLQGTKGSQMPYLIGIFSLNSKCNQLTIACAFRFHAGQNKMI